MKRETIKTDLYELKVSDCACWPRIFKVNGRDADYHDFGEHEDLKPEDAPPHGCGDNQFIPLPPNEDILNAYGITSEEYAEICEVLKRELSFGRCRYCD